MLIAAGVLGALLTAEPAAAQNEGYAKFAKESGRSSSGTYGGQYFTRPGFFYSTPTYSEPAPSGYVSGYRAFYPPLAGTEFTDVSAPAVNRGVWITVRVPWDATIWFDDTRTTQKGELRYFVSPPLTPGRDFFYEIKAKWTEDGKEVTRSRQVTVHAGDVINVSF
jgi:uncharacterized protein (TIGR03000 family)